MSGAVISNLSRLLKISDAHKTFPREIIEGPLIGFAT